MKINILLPYKEKFDENKASSVSITVRNNLVYSKYLNQIKIYGQNVQKPLFKNNFIGFEHSFLSFKSKNIFSNIYKKFFIINIILIMFKNFWYN